MSNPRPIDRFRQLLTDSIAEQLRRLDPLHPVSHTLLRTVIRQVTDNWQVDQHDSSSEDSVRLGHDGFALRVTTPWQSYSEEELDARDARLFALVWNPEDGPPPPGVSILQLLRQDTWWLTRAPDRPGSSGYCGVRLPLGPIRVEDMTHEHRMSTLAWLRRRADKLHSDAAVHLHGAPDEVWASYDAELPEEWLEEQPLIQALVRWTTPYAESPLTWKPILDIPYRQFEWVAVKSRDDSEGIYILRWDSWSRRWEDQFGHVFYDLAEEDFLGWRDAFPEELPLKPPPPCEHSGFECVDCDICGSEYYSCPHGGYRDNDPCTYCG
jgi:hypothetical protein